MSNDQNAVSSGNSSQLSAGVATEKSVPQAAGKPVESQRLTLPGMAERLSQLQIIFVESQKHLQEYIEEIEKAHAEEIAAHKELIAEQAAKLDKFEDLDARLRRVEQVTASAMLNQRP